MRVNRRLDSDLEPFPCEPSRFTRAAGPVILRAPLFCGANAMGFVGLDYYQLDDELTEEELLVRQNVRKFVEARLDPIIAKHYEAGTFPMELIPEFAKLGLLG